ncbi:MAG: hypothetical protein QXV17_04300 [Candidatus Micrarchaeaceae archaeon]
MNRAAALIVFFSFLLLSTVPALSHATPINGIIFRANVDEMYIEGQPIPIQVQALYFQNSVPQSTSIAIYITVNNLTSDQSFSSTYNVSSGVPQFIYLQALPVGEYSLESYASALGSSSQLTRIEFLVAPPPVPYTANFVSGGLFSFHSDMLNKTGHYNVNYTFTIDIYYQYPGGAAEEVASYTNVTNMTRTFPDEGQTVVINVIDRYGWLNGMNINPSQGIFSGMPYSYDFGITTQQPFYSIYAQNFIPDIIAIALMTIFVLLVYRRLKR